MQALCYACGVRALWSGAVVELKLVFKIPMNKAARLNVFGRLARLSQTLNNARMGGHAKHSLKWSMFAGSVIGDHVTVEIVLHKQRWKMSTIVPSDGLRPYVIQHWDVYAREDWRRIWFQKFGRYQISGPRF